MTEPKPSLTPLAVFTVVILASTPAAMAWMGALGLGVVRGAPMLPVAMVSLMALVLPGIALSGALNDRRLGFSAGIFFWGIVVMASMPLFFPGERARAMSDGWAWIRGAAATDGLISWAARVDALLPPDAAASGDLPVVSALEDDDDEERSRRITAADCEDVSATQTEEAVLPYRTDDNSLVVPVDLQGPEGAVLSTWMTYDTGATLTTVDRATLSSLGIAIPRDNPVIELRTASGVRSARLALIDTIWVGGFEVPGVTVSICEECTSQTSVGLLGLNVTGRFQVVVDHGSEALVLQPRLDRPDQVSDISPWVEVTGRVKERSNGELIVDVDLDNRSRRPVEQAIVHVRCGDTWPVDIYDIPARGTGSARVQLDGKPSCDGRYELELKRAWW
jgi:hypothetical protein